MARRKSSYKKTKKASPQSILLALIFLILSVAGYYIYNKFFKKDDPFVAPKGAISFHFMTLGNKSSGDSIYIKAGDSDILIDAGSTTGSVNTIKNYIDNYVTDGTLEFVIITHADYDHVVGFSKENGSIFDLYVCETIIDFPLTESGTATYNSYLSERQAEISAGANHYTALECYNNENGAQRFYDLSGDGNVKMEILYNYYYENDAANENDYSVCVMFHHGSKKFLFTGDLEEDGEECLAQKYDFSQVELFKAGHHGSENASTEILLKEIKPKIIVVSCVLGDKHDFVRQVFLDRIAKYTTQVYVTAICTTGYTGGEDFADMNGNIIVTSSETDGVTVFGSNNNTPLKDTAWITGERTMPTEWKNN